MNFSPANKFLNFFLIIIFLASGSVLALARPELKTIYGGLKTGSTFLDVIENHPGWNPAEDGAFAEYEKKKFEGGDYFLMRPKDFTTSDRIVAKMKIAFYRPASAVCGAPVEFRFLSGPPGVGADGGRLYSYDYLICDASGEMTSRRMVEQFMDKYGMFDEKDYDRNISIYHQNDFTVGVRGYSAEEGVTGLLITVLNHEVFKEAYIGWRGYLRNVDSKVKNKF